MPNSTQVPDLILDEWLPLLSGAELAIVLFVARKTFGWGKDYDRIGAAQMEAGTGCDRATIFKACAELKALGVLKVGAVRDGHTPNAYALDVDNAECALANLLTRREVQASEKAQKKADRAQNQTSRKKPLVVKNDGLLVVKNDPQETLLETIPPKPQTERVQKQEPAAEPPVTAVRAKSSVKAQDYDPEGFARFYSAYPRHVSKIKALAAWNRLRPDAALQRVLLTAIDRLKIADGWDREGMRFVPHPSTFLAERRWEDELEPAPAAPPAPPPRIYDPEEGRRRAAANRPPPVPLPPNRYAPKETAKERLGNEERLGNAHG